MPQKRNIGITLSGGGARGAYQAGLLRAIYDICKFKESPFRVISGISAGSINGMALAAGAEDFDQATKLLWDTWTTLHIDEIFKVGTFNILKTGLTWMRDLSVGDWLGTPKSTTYLLDTSPLKDALTKNIDMAKITAHLRSGLLHSVALSATNYHTGKSVTFFDGDDSIREWSRNSGIGKRCTLEIQHIMASTAIPIFFPPVRIQNNDYGDGGIGLKAPLSPALHLGAEQIMVIGLEHPPVEEPSESAATLVPVTLGDIAGTLLNSLFLNALDADVGRLEQTNRVLSIFTPEQLRSDEDHLRPVPVIFLRPSQDLGEIDRDQFAQFPFTLRHLLKGLGVSDVKGWDLLSYLAFDKSYATALLELGHKDGIAQTEKIKKFFASHNL
jgi:NTE family protein